MGSIKIHSILMMLGILFLGHTTKANVGQPGIWKAGGGGFALWVESDSLAMESIVLQEEKVHIFLYSGFAVIQGQYVLKNTHQDSLTFTMGYPLNELWRGEDDDDPFGYSFKVDSLAGFEVVINQSKMEGIHLPWEANNTGLSSGQWITWTVEFNPKESKEIKLTYLVSTEGAYVTNMGGKKEAQGLVYIFETGGPWHGVIESAELYIHFEDGLSVENVIGIRPCSDLLLNPEHGYLKFKKSQWEPGIGENIYLLYQKRGNKYYSFQEGVEDRQSLYERINQSIQNCCSDEGLQQFPCRDILDIETKSPYLTIFFSMLTGALILFALLIFLLVKYFKKRKS